MTVHRFEMLLLWRWTAVFITSLASLLIADPLDVQANAFALPKPEDGEKAPQDPTFHAELEHGVKLVYTDQFETALIVLDSLIAVHPNHPGPHFYRAATLQTWMSSRRFNAFQDDLERSVEKTIAMGERMLTENADDPWLDFYMGGAYGYRAYFKFGRYNFLGAYQDGKKGIAHLRTCLKKEPRLYDAYLGLGSYYYWRSARSRVLRWLLFWMDDKRALGLEQIELAMLHGQYSRDESRLVLATGLYDDKQFGLALEVLNTRANGKHLGNTFEIYLNGLLAFEKKDWQAVEMGFRELDERLSQSSHVGTGYLIECKYRIARALSEMGHKDEALKVAQSAIFLRAKRDPEKELESVLWPYGEIKKELDRLYQKLNKQ